MANSLETAKEIFGKALEIDSVTERCRFLEDACAGNETLRTELKDLLDAFDRAGNFLGGRSDGEDPGFDSATTAPVDARIGPYKLREQIGEGGMGLVYVAEQFEPIRRKVALKIIKPGMGTKSVMARFEAERQALAMMDHPHIARVFDGGTTDSGQPFFVMELVHGPTITDYCDQKRLDIRQRLELFRQVCEAVEHAHRKGIIHRDLKPSNVLVPEIDGRATPKVIDFGIAKVLGEKLNNVTVYTHLSQLVGTPAYMSPEQAGMGVIDLDTRSDVYSLGVLLYELLTGSTPFDRESLEQAGYDEMRRMIREDQPRRPSAYVTTLSAEACTTITKLRGSHSHDLNAALRGELDCVVMKALEKDRDRRYDSAKELASDIDRYLNNEVVAARPPSNWYRMRKFVQRNRALVASLVMVLGTLTLGITLAAIGLLQARAERDNARRLLAEKQLMSDILRDLYGGSLWAGERTHTPNRTIRDTLDETSRRLSQNERLPNFPRVEIEIRLILARHYREVQEHSKSNVQALRALQLSEDVHGQHSPEVASVLIFLAHAIIDAKGLPVDFDCNQTRDYAQRALSIHREHGIRSPATASAWVCLGYSIADDPNRQAEAEHAVRQALSIQSHAFAMADLGLHLARHNQQKINEAVDWMAKAVEKSRQENGNQSARTSTILRMQGLCLRYRGGEDDNEQALECFREAWKIYKQAGLNSDPMGYFAGLDMAQVYLVEHRHTEAARILKEIEIACRNHDVIDGLVRCLFVQGWGHLYRDDFSSAEHLFEQALKEGQRNAGPLDTILAYTRFYLARCYVAQGTTRAREAAEACTEVVELNRPTVMANLANDIVLFAYAWACLHSGDDKLLADAQQAIDQGLKTVELWSKKSAMPHFYLARAICEYKKGDLKQAIKTLEAGLERHNDLPTPFRSTSWGGIPTTRRELETTLAEYYLEQSPANLEEAKKVFREGIELRIKCLGEEHLSVALAQLRFGKFLCERKQWNDAHQTLKAVLEKLEGDAQAAAANKRLALQLLAETCVELNLTNEANRRQQALEKLMNTPANRPH